MKFGGLKDGHKVRRRLWVAVGMGFLFVSGAEGTAFPADSLSFADRTAEHFRCYEKMAQEKLYLHTDKPVYSAGETIFLKGYLVNAVNHCEEVPTNFIYVELLNRNDELIVRKKFRREAGDFAGSLDIPMLTVAGDYYLRGYTEWMRNLPSDYFFTKRLQIGNAVVTDINPEVSYETTGSGERVMAIGFFDSSGKPYAGEYLTYRLADRKGNEGKVRSARTDEAGIVRVELAGASALSDDPRVDIVLDEKKYNYRKSFYLNDEAQDYALTFFPEGGRLLAGVPQIVAFKAQNERGFGEPLSGCVLDSRGDTVAPLETEHDGMGKFLLIAREGERYEAEVRSASGVEKRFPLPSAETEGMALALNADREKIHYRVCLPEGYAGPDSLYLLAHVRGKLMFLKSIPGREASGAVETSAFPDGIAHFIVADTAGIPQSERLVFLWRGEAGVCEVVPDKQAYGPREAVSLSVRLVDADRRPVVGNFSVSVTDGKSVPADTVSADIVSSLLLTSDLKGYIDEPNHYFCGNDSRVRSHRDLLMLTHGWTRFKIGNVSEPPRIEVNFFAEAKQFLTGHVTNVLNRRMKEGKVLFYGAGNDGEAEVDENGNFIIDYLNFADTAQIMLQGLTKRGYDGVTVVLDSLDLPAPNRTLYFRDDYKLLTDRYLEQVRDDYFNRGGIPIVSLKEIVVYGRRNGHSRNMGAVFYDKQALEKEEVYSLFDAIRALPDVVMWQGSHLLYRNKRIGTFIIENSVCSADFLRSVDIDCVESVELVYDPSMASFSGVSRSEIDLRSPVAVIRLEEDFKQLASRSPGFSVRRLLGYSAAREFYHPVYDTPEKKRDALPDLRTTLYWDPKPEIDSEGRMELKFYTSDFPENYRIAVEGLTSQGEPFRYVGPVGE